jgi:phage host-nuclease inhibitor protein Gam
MPPKAAAKSVPPVEHPRSWQDCDHLVHLMARTDAQVAIAKAEADKRIGQVNAELQNTTAPLVAQREALAAAVETFAAAHRKDFGGGRSMALAHGRVGWRTTPPAVRLLRPAEQIVADLEARGMDFAIMISKRPSKDVLAEQDAALLRELGVRVTQRDDFYVEYAEASLSEAPTQSA